MVWWRCLVSPVRLSDIFSQHPQCETAGWGHLFGEQLCVTDRGVLWAWQRRRALPSSVLIDCNVVSTHLSNALCGWKYWNLWEHPNRYHSQSHIAQRCWRNRAFQADVSPWPVSLAVLGKLNLSISCLCVILRASTTSSIWILITRKNLSTGWTQPGRVVERSTECAWTGATWRYRGPPVLTVPRSAS